MSNLNQCEILSPLERELHFQRKYLKVEMVLQYVVKCDSYFALSIILFLLHGGPTDDASGRQHLEHTTDSSRHTLDDATYLNSVCHYVEVGAGWSGLVIRTNVACSRNQCRRLCVSVCESAELLKDKNECK